MSFIKESELAKHDDVYTKAKLVELRKSDEFKSPEDWYFEKIMIGLKVVWWTKEGYDKLMDLKKTVEEKKPIDESKIINGAATVIEKYPNTRIVLCSIDGLTGEYEVKVRTSDKLRLKSRIPVEKREDGWYSIFETNEKGKING